MLETRVLLLHTLLLLASSSLCLGQLDTICNNALLTNCEMCINAAPQCSWCPIKPEEHEELIKNATYNQYENIRCRDESSFPGRCDTMNVLQGESQNPQTNLTKLADEALSQTVQENVETIQVRPQRVLTKLRQGDTETFNMSFISLRNTPLDVYFLVDVSASLQLILQSLRRDVTIIGNRLRDISSALAIGFGSYVDKRTLPYSHENLLQYTDLNRNVTSCRAFDVCEPTYVYHHSISLTNNLTYFDNTLPNVSLLSGNLDAPESSMDALVQTALCSDIVGWRPRALKMVFVFTDNYFHFAGDGRLAGLVQPNQGRCNMAPIPGNDLGEYEYTRGLQEDYVSFWQIRNALEANRIIPTFVVQFDGRGGNESAIGVRDSYEAFTSELITIPSQVFIFDDRDPTRNVTEGLITVIQDAYEATVQVVQVGVPRVDGYRFDITPQGTCRRAPDTPDSACLVDFDETVTFSVSVTLEDCSIAPHNQTSVQLQGGAFEFTVIDLEALCECPCSEERITDDTVCSMGQGELVCGVCECNPDSMRTGPECQCPPPPPDQTFFCSNESQCNGFPCDACGICLCGNDNFGEDCRCNIMDDTCAFGTNPNTTEMEHCSGPERGTCVCEERRCNCNTAPLSGVKYFSTLASENPTDNNCECDPDQCYNQRLGGLCYHQGDEEFRPDLCGCTGCQCPGQLFAYRNTCISLEMLCDGLGECVRCFLDRELQDCAPPQNCSILNCHDACTNHTFTQLAFNDEPITSTPEEYHDRCQVEYQGCTVDFYFSTNDADPVIIENDNEFGCPPPTLPWIIAGSLVGAILLLGLVALIILKICLVFLERMEYRKFTQELKDADFAPHENPLYITPQQDYQNPLRRSSRRSQ